MAKELGSVHGQGDICGKGGMHCEGNVYGKGGHVWHVRQERRPLQQVVRILLKYILVVTELGGTI